MTQGPGEEEVPPPAQPAAAAKPILDQADPKPKEVKDLDREERKRNVTLGHVVGYGAMALMGVQVITANVVFILYADHNGWQIPAGAIQAWLVATVVQVIAVVLVITRSLYPPRDPPSD